MKLGIMYCTVTMLNDFQKGMSHVLSCVGGTYFCLKLVLERNTVGKVFRIFTFFEIEGLGLPLSVILKLFFTGNSVFLQKMF